jgi:hypothetical protein
MNRLLPKNGMHQFNFSFPDCLEKDLSGRWVIMESGRFSPSWIPKGHSPFLSDQDHVFHEKIITCQRVMDGSFFKFEGILGRWGGLCCLEPLPTILIVSPPTILKPCFIFFQL